MITLKFNDIPSVEILKQCEEVTISSSGEDFVDLKKSIDLYNKLYDLIKIAIPDISEEQTMRFIIDCVINEVKYLKQEEPK